VVSEEHGTISIAHNGRIIRRLDAQRLETVLRAFYQLDRRPAPPRSMRWLRRLLGVRSPAAGKRTTTSSGRTQPLGVNPRSDSPPETPRRTADG